MASRDIHRTQLSALNDIVQLLGAGGGADANLLNILNEIRKDSDSEVLLVKDAGAANLIIKQIRNFNQIDDSVVISYETIAGTVYVPTGPVEAIEVALVPVTRTHNVITATTAGSVPAGSLRGSALNTGSTNATWAGQPLPPNVAISWEQTGSNDNYGAISYNGTGTSLLIEYTT